ncbi:hypothetical protein ROA7745_00191 [Roseovarius aestuarii]|uniref:Uncharacterized protein n=1 Tax=Roseovarius aestuarii TaxID=475083 RepID=A0A1X7BLF9_9RHOB|nr:hypothetical protein ROA7745_00191 [Roseovarius aestuarii]
MAAGKTALHEMELEKGNFLFELALAPSQARLPFYVPQPETRQ